MSVFIFMFIMQNVVYHVVEPVTLNFFVMALPV